MTSNENNKKTLLETEREFNKATNSNSEQIPKGRQPDQQHHMKDQENMRK